MEKKAFALEEEVRQLCEQKQTKHTALLKQRLVDIYHESMESVHIELEFEFTPDSIKLFFIKLQGMDDHRIQRQLEETSMGASSVILAITLYEILTQRRLLSDFRIIRVLSKWTSSQFSDVNTNPCLESLEWAKKMVQHFGKIQLTVDDGKRHYMLDVLDEWMCILENKEFDKSLLLLDINTTKHLQAVSIRVVWDSPRASCSFTSFFIQT
ncbi:hypothetical protein PsorP6_001839 [Peronosclerospora sorghi]|uniref:Uncharacterized protein n=1 Tax=Peronosclerospora sorghi TaxID=230839 RepID=A0ACC0WUS0_9STRA|nr:hypothetical protein PsorP6_001839 [Peronosclerospora sorghi]